MQKKISTVLIAAMIAFARFSLAVADDAKVSAANKQITNTIGMKFRLIPAGEFRMGSPDGTGYPDEQPLHQVRITRPFYLAAYLVTQAEYERVIGKNPSHYTESGPDAPVDNISWDDAQDFCQALSNLPAEKPAHRTYRLPSEAQWEYACRAGSTSKYYFGDDASKLGDYAWYKANSGDITHPVGEKKPNAWGLYDMLGNIWQLCEDRFDEDFYALSPVNDPIGPGKGSFRVARGGCWRNDAKDCRTAYRVSKAPSDRRFSSGIRLLMIVGDK